jgi:hypothetical protein
MTGKNKAAPWPFSISERAIKGPVLREIKGFLEEHWFPETPDEFNVIGFNYNRAGNMLDVAARYDATFILGLMFVTAGADLNGHFFKGGSASSIGGLINDANLNRASLAYPDLDLKALLLSAAPEMFSVRNNGKTAIQSWIEGSQTRAKQIAELAQAMGGVRLYPYDASCVEDFIAYASMAHYTGHALPESGKHEISFDMLRSLVDLALPFEHRQRGLEEYCGRDLVAYADKKMSKERMVSAYITPLINVIAPMAILFGQDRLEVAQRVDETLRFLFLEMLNDKGALKNNYSNEPFEAAIKVAVMPLLWNHPEHWTAFSLVEADLLGMEVKLLQESDRWNPTEAVTCLCRHAFVPRDGSGGSFGKVALKKLGERYGLFDPKNITRRWGSCNPAWVAGVKDFDSAVVEINYMMKNGFWHNALEGDLVASLFTETAAVAAISEYLQTGGNAKLLRSRSSLEMFPGLVDQMIPLVRKRSEAVRLRALTALTPAQIERLPEHLHETILMADLGL